MVGNVQYAEFAISDLFSISRGDIKNRQSVIELDKVQDESVSFIAQNNSDNGYVSMVDPEEHKVFPGNSIIIGRQTGVVYYQEGDFVTTDGVLVLEPTFGMNERIGLYIISAMTKLLQSFGYDNTVSATKLNNMVIELPTTPSGQPDFDYMENYIKEIEQKHVTKLETDLETRIESLLTVVGRTDLIGNKDAPKLSGTFKVGELFNIYRGENVNKSSQLPGDIAYVTASKLNNGIYAFIRNPTKTYSEMLTVNVFGDVFYQPIEFGINSVVFSLELKTAEHRSRHVHLYLASALTNTTKGKFNYSFKLNPNRLKEESVTLPATPEGEPDWEYMEGYACDIELRVIKKIGAEFKERIRTLREIVKAAD